MSGLPEYGVRFAAGVKGLGAGSRIGTYELLEEAGRGGMAVVFRARDIRLDRTAAVKVLAPAFASDEQFRRRFIRECRAAAAADHPHIIPIYEAGQFDGALFMAMRYISAGDVYSLLRRVGPMATERTAAILSPVASALDAAHALGLVHRDVKPANMLLDAQPGRPDHVYLSDFGLSKGPLSSVGLTGSGKFLGTPNYVAPEQIAGKRAIDGRADQYSLACTAFELLTGAPPFERDHGMAVLYAHSNEEPPTLTSRRSGIPAEVDRVFTRALAKAPGDRYSSCGEFADALRDALGLPPYGPGFAVLEDNHQPDGGRFAADITTAMPGVSVAKGTAARELVTSVPGILHQALHTPPGEWANERSSPPMRSHPVGRRLGRRYSVRVVTAAVVTVIAAAVAIVANAGTQTHETSGSSRHKMAGRSMPPPTSDQAGRSPLSPGWRGDGRSVTLAFGGDVHFEGELAVRLAANPATALGSVSSLFGDSDLSMADFVSALTEGPCPDPQPKQFVFSAPPKAITALKAAHISLISEANDHGEDCGRAGLVQSLDIAKAAHYPVIGIGSNVVQAFSPYRTTINGQRIAIIAATEDIDTGLIGSWTATAAGPGVASAYQEDELVSAVQAARKNSDTVVVYLHWGTEAEQCPNPVQEPLAQALIKAGADIVIGSESHVEEGAGYLGSALVDYGLGNLAFYDTTPPEIYSGALRVTVTGRHIDGFSWRPAQLHDGIPVPLTGSAAATAVQRWRGLRKCAKLTPKPSSSSASRQTETSPFTGPSVSPLR